MAQLEQKGAAQPAGSTASPGSATGTSGSSAMSATPASAALSATLPGASPPGAGQELWPKILRAAWMAILLGFAIEVLLLASAVALSTYKGPRPFLADLAQKVTWSLFVCVGIAFGTAASKARPPVMGLLGLASAPLGFTIARTVHKGMTQALSLAGSVPFASVLLVALVKSLEYGALGWSVGWVGRRRGTLGAHAAAGVAIGLTFGVGLAVLTSQTPDGLAPLPELLAKGINEVFFPIGCSLVLYAADGLGKRLA